MLIGEVQSGGESIADRFPLSDPALHLASVPFMRAIGALWLGGEANRVDLRLPCAPVVHGGVGGDAVDLRATAALLDHAGGAAVYAGVEGSGATATLDLRLDFLGVPPPGRDLYASAGCSGVAAGSAMILGQAWCDDESAPLVRMSARYLVGAGPGEGPVVPDAAERKRAMDRHAGALAPAVDSFAGLLDGGPAAGAWQLPFAPWLVGSVALPALHGAVILAGAMSAAQQAVAQESGLRLSCLTLQFLRAALAVDTRFSASVVKSGARVAFVSGEATQEGGTRRVATFNCLYC